MSETKPVEFHGIRTSTYDRDEAIVVAAKKLWPDLPGAVTWGEAIVDATKIIDALDIPAMLKAEYERGRRDEIKKSTASRNRLRRYIKGKNALIASYKTGTLPRESVWSDIDCLKPGDLEPNT